MAGVERLVDQFEKEVELGGRKLALEVGEFEQIEVAAGLAQLQ